MCHTIKRSQKTSISTASSVLSILHPKHSIALTQMCTNFPRTQQQPPQNSGRQKGDMKQVAYRGPKYTRRQRSQFSRHDSCTAAVKICCQACAHTNSMWGIQHVLSPEIVKVKLKFTPEQAMKFQRGNGGIALLFP